MSLRSLREKQEPGRAQRGLLHKSKKLAEEAKKAASIKPATGPGGAALPKPL